MRIARYLFCFISVLSLALAMLTAVCWARGGYQFALCRYNYYTDSTNCWSCLVKFASYGSVSFEFDLRHLGPAHNMRQPYVTMMYPPGFSSYVSDPKITSMMIWPTKGYRADHSVETQGIDYRSDFFVLAIHPAIAIPILLVLPAICIDRIVRKRRAHAQGLCPNCGYDLCATPDRCPECGTVPAAKMLEAV